VHQRATKPKPKNATAPGVVFDALRRPSSPLDAETRSSMEARLGTGLAHVRVHADDLAAVSAEAVDAAAYTVGSSIVFGRDRYAPRRPEGRRLLAHELVHTLQQRGHEPPAADRALRIEPEGGTEEQEAERTASSGALGRQIGSSLRTAAVQRALMTWGGEWTTDEYAAKKDVDDKGNAVSADQYVRGADMKLRFKPNSNVNAELLGLTQTAQSYHAGKPAFPPGAFERSISKTDARAIGTGKGETDQATQIDRKAGYTNPIYEVRTKASTSLADPNASESWGQLGWRYTDGTKTLRQHDATLIDTPRIWGAVKDSRQVFEVTALATKGFDAGSYYGSVRWGWRTDSEGALSKIDLAKVSDGMPSSTFLKAASLWDKGAQPAPAKSPPAPATNANVPLNAPPVMVTTGPVKLTPDVSVMLPIALPVGTRVRIVKAPAYVYGTYGTVTVVHGPHVGVTGRVDAFEWSNLASERP